MRSPNEFRAESLQHLAFSEAGIHDLVDGVLAVAISNGIMQFRSFS